MQEQQNKILSSLFAGLISGLVTLTYSVSYAALIFSGDMSEYLSLGVGTALISAAVVAFIVALRSSLSFAIAGPDSNASAILALMVSALVINMQGDTSTTIASTVFLAMLLSTLLVGLVQFLIGKLQLGYLVRFIPYPVLGGFLAGTGWLIAKGAFTVMTGVSVNLDNLSTLFAPELLWHLTAGVTFAIVLKLSLSRFQHFLIFPGLLISGIVLTHLWLLISGMSPDEASKAGWLFESFKGEASMAVWSQIDFNTVRWDLLWAQSGNMLAMTGVVIITILLNATGIEVATQNDADLDKEMSASGLANIVSGACGGMIGYLSISRSILNYKAGSVGRVSGVVAALLCASILFFDSSVLAYIPRLVLGGLLLYLGLLLLKEWVYDSWYKLSHYDYALVMVILLVIAGWGFLQGVSLGLLISVVLFVVNYSQIDIVKRVLSGINHRSSFVRPLQHEVILKEHGDDTYILTLQGYLFFGTANNLLEQVRSRFKDMTQANVRFVVMDFRLVTGLDSSVALSFIKIKQLAGQNNARVCFTDLTKESLEHFEKSDLREDDTLKFFSTLDYCVQWCEDEILKHYKPEESISRKHLKEQLSSMFLQQFQTEAFLEYLKRIEVDEGEYIFRQGDEAEAMYFIESGMVTALLEQGDGSQIRLLTMGSGTIFGEMGLYTSEMRSASIKTEEKSSLYVLNRDALIQMEKNDPPMASKLHRFIVRLLAERIELSNRKVRMLLQ